MVENQLYVLGRMAVYNGRVLTMNVTAAKGMAAAVGQTRDRHDSVLSSAVSQTRRFLADKRIPFKIVRITNEGRGRYALMPFEDGDTHQKFLVENKKGSGNKPTGRPAKIRYAGFDPSEKNKREADRIDGFDRDDLGESPDF
jgi:hypothetical protein